MNSTTETGYTRAQFADAVDEAHEALHEVEDMDTVVRPSGAAKSLRRAHEALHRVGAGLPRVGCATQDPEAQAILADLSALRDRELPCGHTLADLIGGTEADGRPCVTTCGACLAERQTEIKLSNRLTRAWRASGLPLGKLVVLAANEYAFGAAVSLTGIVDEALVEMCERYVREHTVAPDPTCNERPAKARK